MKTSVLRGALFALLAFTIFACGDALVKLAGLSDVPLTLIVIISGTAGAMTTFLFSAFKRNLAPLRPVSWKPHAIMTCIFIAQSYVSIEAFTNLPLTTVYVGLFASPFIISLFGALFMGEPLSRKQIIGIIVGFLGVLIALSPEFSETTQHALGNPIRGYIALPLFMGLYISAMLLLRIMGRTETPESITFVSLLGRAVFLIPVLLFIDIPDLTTTTYLYMIGVGVCAGFGFILMSRAYQLAPVAITSPFHYSQLITGALLGYLIWQTIPDLWVFVGGAIIIASGLVIAHEAHSLGKDDPNL